MRQVTKYLFDIVYFGILGGGGGASILYILPDVFLYQQGELQFSKILGHVGINPSTAKMFFTFVLFIVFLLVLIKLYNFLMRNIFHQY